MRTIQARTGKIMIARQVSGFDSATTKKALLENFWKGMDFQLADFGPASTYETAFDVAVCPDYIYISILAQIYSKTPDNKNVTTVEVLLSPTDDGISFLQFAHSSDGSGYENKHLPRRNAELEDFQDLHAECVYESNSTALEDTMRFFFFKLRRAPFGERKHIGLNIGRIQPDEASSWNMSGGGGFPDPDSFGKLYFSSPGHAVESAVLCIGEDGIFQGLEAKVPEGVALPETGKVFDVAGNQIANLRRDGTSRRFTPDHAFQMTENGIYRIEFDLGEGETQDLFVDFTAADSTFHTELQGVHDFPDSFFNTSYTKELFEEEFRFYRSQGLTRIYWIDYPDYEIWSRRFPDRIHCHNNLKEFGRDFLPCAVRAAKKAGLEFISVFKPFDLFKDRDFMSECTMTANRNYLPHLQSPVRGIFLYKDDSSEFPFQTDSVKVYASEDNSKYSEITGEVMILESVVERKDALWFGGRVEELEKTRTVRVLEIRPKDVVRGIAGSFFSLEIPTGKGLVNRAFRLLELEDSNGQRIVPRSVFGKPQEGNYDFSPSVSNAPSWVRLDTGMDQWHHFPNSACSIGISTEWPEFFSPVLEIACPETRKHFLSFVKRAADAGADGFEIRLAHHSGCADWQIYMQKKEVVAEFQKRTGRSPLPKQEDFLLLQKIRGDFYTEFLREAREYTRTKGMKFLHHIENRLLVEEDMDHYCQIAFDWRNWIKEKLFDEISLKYITPHNRIASQELIPLARKHNMKINLISALVPGDRTVRMQTLQSAIDTHAAALDGYALYELWLYSRTFEGNLVPRMQSRKIMEVLRQNL